MNPLTNVKNIQKLNERELQLGIIGKKSWHDEYKDSAWVFTGGLPFDLTEGDIICVFSQYGEVVNLNLIREPKTGKSRGYGFLCYEDQRSTVLAVDNLNGIKILGRTIRVDHVKDYKIPKEHGDEDEATLKIRDEGCAPKLLLSSEDETNKEEVKTEGTARKQAKIDKNSKKHKKKKKKRKASTTDSSSDGESSNRSASTEEQEKFDRKYEQARGSPKASGDRQRRDIPRLEGSRSGHDVRSSSQRSDRDLRHKDSDDGSSREREISQKKDRSDKDLRHRDSDDGSSREREISQRKDRSDRDLRHRDSDDGSSRERETSQRKDYNRDRSESNGSNRKNDFNRMLNSGTVRRDWSRESDNYRGRESDNYRGRESDNYRGRESDNYRGREFNNYRGRENNNYRGREFNNYRSRGNLNYRGRENNNYRGRENNNYRGRGSFNYRGRERQRSGERGNY